MLLSITILIIGLFFLTKSADFFTNYGVKVAKLFNLSPLLIGILIFGFGTSAPEILVSSLAAIEHSTDLSIANALGSNIINISLVLGLGAIISPIQVHTNILKKEWIILMIATIVAWYLLSDNILNRPDGIILITLLAFALAFLSKTNTKPYKVEVSNIQVDKSQSTKIWLGLILSLIVLIISAEMVVYAGLDLARKFGISEAIIGLTLIAFGTSLPELAVAISSAIKKQHDMIIGNIIGSNLFNTLAVLAMPALIYPNMIDPHFLKRDYPIVFGLTVLLFLVAYKLSKSHQITRFGGMILVLSCLYYLGLLFYGY